MDVIIQLIIILIVIGSVLKRVKEISQKGQELDKEKIPKQIRDMLDLDNVKGEAGQETVVNPAEQQEMSDGGYSEPVEISGKPSAETAIPIDILDERDEIPEIVDRDIFDTQPEPIMSQEELIEEPVPIIPKPLVSRPAQKVHSKKDKSLDLGFTGPEVINGFIMGEILGPPVSMRHDERVV